MAKNWEDAQSNEKKFWKEIYLDQNPKDNVYQIAKNEDLISFTKQVCERHEIKIENFSDKVLIDIGCGPFGIIKGLSLIDKDQNINIKKIFGIDPLMDFFKKNIGILKEDEHLELINSQGEKIPLKDQIADYIFSSNVLDHCHDPEKVISEADRVLKDSGEFFCSVHVVYPSLSIIAPFLKYVDKNHPKHFTEKFFLNILKTKFRNIKVTYRAKMFEDHPKFKFSNIISNKNILRGIKRFLSHYILYTVYFSCKK